MELDVSFYEEIFKKELYWTDLASKNLLNVYYINGVDGLKDFYLEKLEVLNSINDRPKLEIFINIINEILDEIDSITNKYNNSEDIDINKLVSLFIVNQITNKKSN